MSLTHKLKNAHAKLKESNDEGMSILEIVGVLAIIAIITSSLYSNIKDGQTSGRYLGVKEQAQEVASKIEANRTLGMGIPTDITVTGGEYVFTYADGAGTKTLTEPALDHIADVKYEADAQGVDYAVRVISSAKNGEGLELAAEFHSDRVGIQDAIGKGADALTVD